MTAAGFRVLNVQPHSPASDVVVFPSAEAARDGLRSPLHASLVSYLDFIVSVNGEPLGGEDSEFFAEEIRANINQPVILEVFNVMNQKLRTLQVVPRTDWGGEGLLGLHVKFDVITGAAESVLHVTEVEPGSPAAVAGLTAGDDYILGSAEGVFENVSRAIAIQCFGAGRGGANAHGSAMGDMHAPVQLNWGWLTQQTRLPLPCAVFGTKRGK